MDIYSTMILFSLYFQYHSEHQNKHTGYVYLGTLIYHVNMGFLVIGFTL